MATTKSVKKTAITPVTTAEVQPVVIPAEPAVKPKKPALKQPKQALKKASPASKPAAKKPLAKKPLAKPAPDAAKKVKKPKLVRDSFTIPKDEYAALDVLKSRAIKLAQPAKKSELLRAGILVLAAMDDAKLLESLKAVTVIKTGRPKN
jgi:hypothetical protein